MELHMDQPLSHDDSPSTRARKCTLLSFEVESPGVSIRSRRAIIVLGGEDGAVDRIVIKARDGIRLVERLAFAFRDDERAPAIEYGSRAWFSRNSIGARRRRLRTTSNAFTMNQSGSYPT